MLRTLIRLTSVITIICAVGFGCDKQRGEAEGEKKMSSGDAIIKAKIIRAGAELNDPVVLEKDEFLQLMDEVLPTK